MSRRVYTYKGYKYLIIQTAGGVIYNVFFPEDCQWSSFASLVTAKRHIQAQINAKDFAVRAADTAERSGTFAHADGCSHDD